MKEKDALTPTNATAARLEQARRAIRFLSIAVALLVGVVGGMTTGIALSVLAAPALVAVGSGGGAFIGVSTLALVVEARVNRV
ncbi:hypothetical protein [Streptomyces violarus]|uniref:hypothetical protein n=1 Tax=Streptomyces violarus TaxID=67380 RepID=UPI0021BF8DD1|nr:hypothetical protein [Streptomyces violarus]MCT9141801.1 hypothetical protein [Streptomyces violarus]